MHASEPMQRPGGAEPPLRRIGSQFGILWRYAGAVLAEITFQLAAFPERAWPRFAALTSGKPSAAAPPSSRDARASAWGSREEEPSVAAPDAAEPSRASAWGSREQLGTMPADALPTPLRHVLTVASTSVLATGLGASLRPGATVAGVVLASLAALLGYMGGAACAVELSSRWIVAPDATPHAISRFASGAVLPVAVSGIPNILPLVPLSLVLALAGAAASVHSGWIGASAMLALEGKPRKRAAAVPAGVAVGLVLLATLGRVVLPT